MRMAEREPEIDQQPRKRIAVACGRCRKRKIRCSGDPGNGEPCTNCRNVNAEPCQFLRVASQETPILHDRGSFSYDVETARNHHARQPAPFNAFYPPMIGHNMPDVLARYYPTPASSATAARIYSTTPAWAAVPYYNSDYDAAMSPCNSSYYAHEPAATYPHSVDVTEAVAPRPFNHNHHDDHHHYRNFMYTDANSVSAVPAAHPSAVSKVPSVQSASSSADGSPTENVHCAAYDHTSSLASSNSRSHRESISTSCSSGTYASSTGSLAANVEPLMSDYRMRKVPPSPPESGSMGLKSLPFITGRGPSSAASTTNSSTSPKVWDGALSVLPTHEISQTASAPIR